MSDQDSQILIFILVTTALLFLLAAFIVGILYLYQKKQLAFRKQIEEEKLDHEKNILRTELEIQEQTFYHISKEIHDNIGLSLSLAKLQLNILKEANQDDFNLNSAIFLLSQSIEGLSDLSKSLNSDYIEDKGFIKALAHELNLVASIGKYKVNLEIEGEQQFIEKSKEVIIFRVLQEALNNIIKHSNCTQVDIRIIYDDDKLIIGIKDNGKGIKDENAARSGLGLKNMETRVKILKGSYSISSQKPSGTLINFSIPLNQQHEETNFSCTS